MKKTILTITLSALGALILVTPVLATTIVSFSPVSVSIKPGQSFNVSVTVDPQGINNYVEKVELNYPADRLQVNSFTLGSAWMALTQPGYDLIDNINGVLVKSAGYPGGFSSATTFGTISFYAKKAGSGIIKLGSNSLAFEVNSQSAISGSPISFTITAPVVTVPKSSTTESPIASPSATESPIATPSTTESPVASPSATESLVASSSTTEPANIALTTEQPVAQTVARNSLMAGVSDFLTLGTSNALVGILMVILILVIAVYVIYTLIQKKRKNFGKIK